LHNLLLCSRAGALFRARHFHAGLPSSRLLHSTSLPTALSSPVFSPLETPKAPKGEDGGRKGGGFKSAGTLPTSRAIPFHSHLSRAPIWGRRRPWAPDLCSRSSPRTSTSSQGQSASLSVLSYPSPSISFWDIPARVLLCSSPRRFRQRSDAAA
jgi:hypothetical protein